MHVHVCVHVYVCVSVCVSVRVCIHASQGREGVQDRQCECRRDRRRRKNPKIAVRIALNAGDAASKAAAKGTRERGVCKAQ